MANKEIWEPRWFARVVPPLVLQLIPATKEHEEDHVKVDIYYEVYNAVNQLQWKWWSNSTAVPSQLLSSKWRIGILVTTSEEWSCTTPYSFVNLVPAFNIVICERFDWSEFLHEMANMIDKNMHIWRHSCSLLSTTSGSGSSDIMLRIRGRSFSLGVQRLMPREPNKSISAFVASPSPSKSIAKSFSNLRVIPMNKWRLQGIIRSKGKSNSGEYYCG